MLAGTYLGLVEKLDYLQALGVNAVELLPVQEFNELEYYQVAFPSCMLQNFWNENKKMNYLRSCC